MVAEDTPVRGNAPVWARLTDEFPRVAVLQGPAGVGKFYGASRIAATRSPEQNMLLAQGMSAEDARSLIEWTGWKSASPKVAVLEPGDCYSGVWTIIKNVVEELPAGHHVWVCGSHKHPVPNAVAGLGFRYDLTLLSKQEMAECFMDVGAIPQDEPYLTSLGSIDTAMEMNKALNVAAAVASWFESVGSSHRGLLMTAARNWEQRHTDLLVAEIEKQLVNKTLIEAERIRGIDTQQLLRTITYLHNAPTPYIGAVTAGLTLMGQRR